MHFVGPCRTIRIGSNFWKFYHIRTSFTLREPVFLVKVFRSEPIFLAFRVWTQCTASYLLGGPVCLWCLVSDTFRFDRIFPLQKLKMNLRPFFLVGCQIPKICARWNKGLCEVELSTSLTSVKPMAEGFSKKKSISFSFWQNFHLKI
jgi:hypothetical protein